MSLNAHRLIAFWRILFLVPKRIYEKSMGLTDGGQKSMHKVIDDFLLTFSYQMIDQFLLCLVNPRGKLGFVNNALGGSNHVCKNWRHSW